MGSSSALNNATSGKFRFDREMWLRFQRLAQPYFYPIEVGGSAWGTLLVALLVGVVSGTFWLSVFGAAVAVAVGPASLVPEHLGSRLSEMLQAPWPQIAALCLMVSMGVALTRKEQLKGRWKRWCMLGMLIFLLLCVTGLNVFLSYVFRGIDNTMVDRDAKGFYTALWNTGVTLVVAVPVIGAYKYVRQKLARQWRGFLCEFFLARYLAQRAYYKLDSNSEDTNIDNPDQRIAEDVQYFTNETLQFLLDILGGVLDLLSFSAILWTTSKSLMGSLMAYATVGTIVALAIGHRLVAINYEQLRREADLRYSLIHVRDNAEAIAFYNGESQEGNAIRERLGLALGNYDSLIRWSVLTTLYQRTFFYMARIVPYLVIGGLYFAKEVDFGTVGQGTFAFSMVLSAVTLIVERIADISRFSAGISRLGAFYEALEEPSPSRSITNTASAQTFGHDQELESLIDGARKPAGIQTILATKAGIEINSLTLQTPTGRNLVENLHLSLNDPGGDGHGCKCLLIVGNSGAGKSSLLRAIAGLWARGAGAVRRPPAGEMLFLPQKPYMPLGDLRMQLLYPNLLAHHRDDELLAVLGKLGLGDLPGRFPHGFDEVQDWGRVLSGGEQQRLAAARCLAASPPPALIVLDEATSALPVADEANLYQLLRQRGLGYISVGHRESLLEYHDLVLEICGDSSWRLMQPQEYRGWATRIAAGTTARESNLSPHTRRLTGSR